MPNLTVSLPADLKKRMGQYQEINWSAVARQAIADKVALLAAVDLMLEKSELTEADIAREAREIKKRVWKKHRQT